MARLKGDSYLFFQQSSRYSEDIGVPVTVEIPRASVRRDRENMVLVKIKQRLSGGEQETESFPVDGSWRVHILSLGSSVTVIYHL